MNNETTQSNYYINPRKSNTSSGSVKAHTKEYPCSQCNQSLASRLRYHTIPKLKLRDTVWIPGNNNKHFFVVCYTEPGPQSDGILDELRQAEIGIREGSKVFVIPLNCALGIQQAVDQQKTVSRAASETSTRQEERIELPDVSPPAHDRPLRSFLKSIRTRLTVHKIIGSIQRQSSLTFDYLFFCVLASVIACLGLLEDSTV